MINFFKSFSKENWHCLIFWVVLFLFLASGIHYYESEIAKIRQEREYLNCEYID